MAKLTKNFMEMKMNYVGKNDVMVDGHDSNLAHGAHMHMH